MTGQSSRLRRLIKILKWKWIHLGPRRDITMDTWNGLLTCDSKDWLIGKYLYVNRDYERANIKDTLGLLEKEGLLGRENKGIVLDVGANIGMIAVAVLKHRYFERAVAFEPDPNNYRLLTQNIAQNGMKSSVSTFQCALSSPDLVADKTGAILERSPDNFGDHRIRRSGRPGFFHEENRSTVKVTLDTLDRVLENSPELQAEDIALVWIDIQGHEGYFFEGARGLFKRQIPVVSEFWPYGILRSGMSVEAYSQIVRSLFTHFYYSSGDGGFRKMPITEIAGLFDTLKAPRSGGQVIFAHDKC